MDFGRDVDIEKVDFRLPPDAQATSRALARGESGTLEVYVGAPRWSLPDWVGRYYPEGSPRGQFLAHYGRLFNTVELNSTFYAIPAPQTVRAWASAVPVGFRFAPKVYRAVSHEGRLRGVDALVERYAETVRLFGDRLGTCFLQLPPSFGSEGLEHLRAFLRLWPVDLDLAVEFRRPSWFRSPRGFDLLEQYGAAAVVTDSPGRRDAVHMRLTCPQAFVRFLGNDLHPSDTMRIDAWIDRIALWAEKGLRRLWFFFHQPREINSPVLAAYLIEGLNQRLGLELKAPRPLQPLLDGEGQA